MASNYTNLGVQLMTTGEKAGTWGTLTNTNWNIIEQIAGGYVAQALTDNGTLTLTKNDGTTGATLATRLWKLTGTLSAGNSIVTVPDGIENWWLVNNAEGGSTYTVTVKTVSGTGVAWAAGETGTKLLYTDGTNVVDSGLGLGDVTLTGTQTLTNKTLTSPKIGTSILDTGGNELLGITVTGSAENEFTIAAGASGAGPTLSSTGSSDSNIDINVTPKGTGDVVLAADTTKVGDAGAAATLTSNGAGSLTVTTGGTEDLVLSTNSGTNSGTITITDGANGDMTIAPNGYGRATITGQGKVGGLAEKVTTEATAATGTVNYDCLTQAVWNFTTAASGNWTLNIRGDGSTTLNAIMDAGESITIAHLVLQTGSAYYNSAVTIDGSSITPEWQGGTAPAAGNTNSIDVYQYTIIKTGDAAFTALASQTQFA
jgi:hypothetical protein